ncbi:MAG: hypothetical protein ACR2HD_04755 [Solirubrobacteraceae bacterium]|nr:MAG: hypothetical protein DLM63_10790 [Solirubrobacterales bacterium]
MLTRHLAAVACACALVAASAGCGQLSVASHRGSGTHGLARVALCSYHAWRAVHDVRHGYGAFALFHAYALRRCVPHHHH